MLGRDNQFKSLFGDLEAPGIAQIIPLQWFVNAGVPISQAAYQNMIAEYARDGKPVTGRVNDPFRVRVQVKFLRDYTQEVDLQVEGALPPADSPFNIQGVAQVKNMLQGEPTSYAKDDTAYFDGVTAQRLEQAGIVERVGDPIYVRPARSFEYGFENFQKRFSAMSEEKTQLQSRVEELKASIASLEEQIEKHRIELQQLQQDRQGFEAEKTELLRYKTMLEQRFQQLQKEVDSLAVARR